MNLDSLLDRIKSLRGSMTPAQLVSLAAAFVGVVGAVVAFAFWINQPTYRLLFSDMDAESAAAVTERLRADDVQYQLVNGGTGIQVPAEQIDELRLAFAGAGLPQSGRLGFEIFDRTQFGTTEFMETVNLRRALEGEIARTISTIGEIASARVHIAMAKDSLFQAKEQPAKASVVVRLKGRTPLDEATVVGIRNLVAFAVEGLRPELVTILDTQGRPLTSDAGDGAMGPLQGERQQRFERELAARVVSLIEPVVGAGRVRVNVAARLHLDTEDRIQETWDPNPVPRGRVVQSNGSGGVPVTQGVAGAQANLPAPVPPGQTTPPSESLAPPPTRAVSSGPTSFSETVNYEVGRVTVHTQRPRGDVARLSVAVILDDEELTNRNAEGQIVRERKPRDPAQLQKINALVAAAVGLDTTRGDSLTVENIAFEQPMLDLPEDAAPTAWWRTSPLLLVGVGVGAVVLLGGLALVVLKGRKRPARQAQVTVASATELLPPQQLPRTIAEIESEIAQQLDLEEQTSGTDRRVPVMAKRLTGNIAKDPEAAARLMRAWLGDEKKAS